MASSSPAHVEAEIKVELTREHAEQLPTLLKCAGLRPAASGRIVDRYLTYTPSSLGGWDFTRLREDDGDFTLTEKRWAPVDGAASVRLEHESAVDADEAQRLLSATPGALVLRKDRRTFTGDVEGLQVTVALDTLDLAGAIRYFVEAEHLTTPEQAQAVREALRTWMRDALHIQTDREAPSMLELIRTAMETDAQ